MHKIKLFLLIFMCFFIVSRIDFNFSTYILPDSEFSSGFG